MMNGYATSYAGSSIGSPANSDTSPMGPPTQEFQSVTSPQQVVPSIPSSVEQYNVAATGPTDEDVLMQPGITTSANEEVIATLVEHLLSDYTGDVLDDMSGDLLNNNSFFGFPSSSSSSNSAMANGT